MGIFSPYVYGDRLESLPVQSGFRNQTSPMVQATSGALHLYQGCQNNGVPGGAPGLAASALTLPDGRLNVGIHLPLLAKRYRYLSVLGEGVSAQVLLVEDTLRPGRLVTVKVMKRQHAHLGHREARALRFLHTKIQNGISAPGIVRLLDTFTMGAHFCLVLERLYPRLLDWVAESAALVPSATMHELRKISYQVLVSVAFLHSHGLVHADIKPDNLLLRQPPGSPGLSTALVDLGGAFSTTETNMDALLAEVQTLPYRAPEVALGLACGETVDEWSVGVVLAEAALKRPLFPCTSAMDLVQAMAAQLGPFPAEIVAVSELGQRYDLSSLVMPPPPGSGSGAGTEMLLQGRARHLPYATLNSLLGGLAMDGCDVQQYGSSSGIVPLALRQVDPLFADLIAGLLLYDPSKRLKAKQALLHPFFAPLTVIPAIFPELFSISPAAHVVEGASPSIAQRNSASLKQPSCTPTARPPEIGQIRRSSNEAAIEDMSCEGRNLFVGVKPSEYPDNDGPGGDTSELAASAVGNREPEDQQQTPMDDLPGASRSRSGSGSGSDRAGRAGGQTGEAKRARRDRSSGMTESKSKPWWMV